MSNLRILIRSESHSIEKFLKQTKNNPIHRRIVGPERPFNFNKNTVLDFLESLIRGCPLHIVLATYWSYNAKITSRPLFSSSTDPNASLGHLYDTEYLLDGYQRLQTLYTAYNGFFNDEKIFYDLSAMNDMRRFRLEKRQKGDSSLIRIDKMSSYMSPSLPRNWLFDAIGDNINSFNHAFTHSFGLHITVIHVSKVAPNTPASVTQHLNLLNFDEALGAFLTMLVDPQETSHFREVAKRLQSFLELVDSSD